MLVLGSMLMALAASAADAPTVADYYQRLPAKFFSEEEKFELEGSKNHWTVHSPRTQDELPITVDTKNGYIQISDEGTGEGDHQVQVALFLKADKTPVLAIRESDSDTLGFSGRVTFVEPTGNTWKGVNDRVLPALRPEDFLAPACLAALDPEWKAKVMGEKIEYVLPRQGTTIRASARIHPRMLKAELQDKASPCAKDSVRELKWDKKEGRFTLEPARPTGKSGP